MARATRCRCVLFCCVVGGGAEDGLPDCGAEALETADGGNDNAATAADANGLRGVAAPLDDPIADGESAGFNDSIGGRKELLFLRVGDCGDAAAVCWLLDVVVFDITKR